MALVLTALTFTACSDDDEDMQNDIVGKWQLVLDEEWDKDSNGSIIESSHAAYNPEDEGCTETINFTKDGKAEWSFVEPGYDAEYEVGTYSISDGVLTINYEDGDSDVNKIEKLSKDQLVLTRDHNSYFQKSTWKKI